MCTNMMNNIDSARLAIFILAMDLKKRTVYKANRILIINNILIKFVSLKYVFNQKQNIQLLDFILSVIKNLK